MNSNTLMIVSSMDSVNNNFGKSFTQLVDLTLKPSLSKDSANTFKKNSPAEKLPSDHSSNVSFKQLNLFKISYKFSTI